MNIAIWIIATIGSIAFVALVANFGIRFGLVPGFFRGSALERIVKTLDRMARRWHR